MQIRRNGSRPISNGPAESFTGAVRIEPLFQSPGPAQFSGASVTFEPGARSAWHTHPCGQTLIVTAGVGWTQCWGEPKEEIHAGDVVTCPPDIKHWHGAASTTAMTHIAIQGGEGRQDGGVAGEGDRRAIPVVTRRGVAGNWYPVTGLARIGQLVVCIENTDYPASLEKRKIYVALRDQTAETHGLLRVIDESGEDYLYPKTFFRPIELPQTLRRAVLAAA